MVHAVCQNDIFSKLLKTKVLTAMDRELQQSCNVARNKSLHFKWTNSKVASESFLNGCKELPLGKPMSLKILVVEDEPVRLKLVPSLAVSSGHTVYTFDDSQEAGERAENQRLDVTPPRDLSNIGIHWLYKP